PSCSGAKIRNPVAAKLYGRHMSPMVFFFSSRRRHTRFSRDWSSDVCSSDLRLVELVELGSEHLVLADIGGDIRLAVGGTVKCFHHLLRLEHAVAVLLVTQAMILTPAIDLFPPARQRLGIRLDAGFPGGHQHFLKHLL